MLATPTATHPATTDRISVLQQDFDSAWLEFFGLGDQPWAEQRGAALRVLVLRHQIENLGAVPR